MVDYDNFPRSKEFLTDDDRSQGFLCDTACVANDLTISVWQLLWTHMSIPFLQAQRSCGVNPCIHAHDDSDFSRRRERKIALLERTSVFLVCLFKFFGDGHVWISEKEVNWMWDMAHKCWNEMSSPYIWSKSRHRSAACHPASSQLYLLVTKYGSLSVTDVL